MDYSLQQEYDNSKESDSDNNSSILSILDFHLISKNRRNIYSFIHIHTNTSD